MSEKDKNENKSGYGKEMLNVLLFTIFMIVCMLVLMHFKP